MKAKEREKGGPVVGTRRHFSMLHNDPGLSRHNEHTHTHTHTQTQISWRADGECTV